MSTTTLYVTAAVAEHVVDNNLAQCIQGAVNDPDTTPVTQVTLLKCVGTQGIQNLDGLEVFTSVEHLAFASISFADIDALACTTVDQFNNTVSCYPNLTRIELEQSTITDLTPMASVTALEWLELNGSTLTSLVPITSLPNLSVLQLEDAFVTTLGNWAGSSLEALHAKGSNLTDLSAFSGASSLRFIDVFDAPISTLDHITVAHMPALEELTVKGMFGLSLTPIASASNLKVLNLSENQNTSHGYISPLNNLESLVLDPNVSNIDFVSGKNLSQLHINGVLSGIGSLNALADQYLMANLDLTGVASGVSLAPIMDMLAGHYNIGGLQLNIDLSGADCSEQQQLQDVLASYGHQYSYDPLGCVVPGPTVTGINKVTNLGYTWQSPGQDENLILTWSYPEDQFTTTAGDISSFNIQPVMSSSTIENVSVTNGWQSSWTSMVIDNAAYPGAAYRVQACIGSNCGEWVTTDLTFVGTADFPAPVWQPGAAINQTDNPAFALAWTEVNHSDVDYYEVMELINNFDDYYHGNSVNELHVSGQIFYTENTSIQFERTLKKHSSDPAGNQETARYYRYIVRACSRDTVATDPCGQWSTIQSVTLRYDNDRPKKVTNLEWVEVTGSGFQLRWDYNIINFQDPEKKPDFFFFRNEDNHASAGYLHAQNWDATGWVTDVMTDRGDWRVWACKKNSNTPAVINSSFIPNQLGHICDNIAPGAIIDTDPTTNPNPPDDTVSTPLVPRPGTLANYDCVGNGCSTRSQGGPGEMIPGEWWDPDRSGTGWSFYWANELRYPSLHEDLYKDAYDLIAVWYTYRAIDGDDQWRPVWYFAQLKHVETASSENVYRGSLLYPQGINHPNHNHPAGESHVSGDQHLNIGTITVHYEVPSPDTNIDPNEYVEVVIQANQDRGMYLNLVDGSDTLKLQHFASDNNVAGLCTPSWDDRSDNPIDHYSGMWWNVTPGPNGEAVVDERFAVFNQIQKNYESIQIVFYDDNGEPIWGRADRGTTDSGDCENSSLGETDFDVVTVPYGFDPTGNTPVGFWGGSSDSPLESIVKNEGGIDQLLGRTFHSDNLRRGEIWGKLDLSEILNYDRSGTLDLGTESNPTGKPQSGTYYQKAASFHDIRYFVGESPETVESCHINSTGPGQFTCDISITWFTDGYYPDSFAYYTDDNGVNWNKLTTNVNEPITCDSSVNNTSGFVKEDIACSISSPGSYQFALMKQNWLEAPVSNHTIAMIAKSSVLSVTADSVPAAQGQAVPDSSASNAHAHPGHNSYIGTVGGSGGVSGGAATYTIPIQLPPGRQGMQPAISVNYSSRGGNGVLGMGWSMSGLSSVHRCPQTVAQDTMLDTVTFDDSDRLCLDGQRLMLRTTGDYWSSTAEYQTEIDSYARVRATSNGFEVFSKSGIVRLYETPVIPAGSPTVPLSWFITSETDPAGNDIRYTYSTYGDGEVLVDSIHYTGTAGSAAGNRRVDFHYLSRPDASFSYLSGHRTEQTMRLDRITTHAPVSETDLTIVEVGDYQFSYEQSAATGRTLLNAVSRGAGSSAKPATIFTWDQVAQGHRPRYFDLKDIYDPTSGLDGNSDPQSEPEDAIMPAGMSVYGDLNGDGYSEILYSVDTGATNDSRETYLLSGADLVNGSDDINPLATGNHQLMANSLYPGSAKSDINNDGRIDIIGWSRPATVSPTAPINLRIGSWRGEVDWPANGGAVTLEDRMEFVDISTVSSEIIAINFANYQTYGPRDSLYVTDVNGDGLQDIVIHERQVAEPSCSGSSDNRQLVWYQNTGLIDNMPTFGSRQLIHCMSRSEDEVELMRFAEFFTSIYNPDNFTGIEDIDGNGLPDFRIDRAAYLQNSGDDDINDGAVMTTRDINGNLSFDFRSYRSSGGTCPTGLGTDQFLSNVYYQYGDFNGDGLSDLIYHDEVTSINPPNAGTWKIQFNLGQNASSNACLYGSPVDTGLGYGLEGWDWCDNNPQNCETHQWRPKYAASIRVGDIDNDGRDELMIPSLRLYESCVNSSWTSVNPPLRSGSPEIVCGDDMYDAVNNAQTYGEHDNGIYEYATLDFDTMGINSGQATVTEQTGLIAAANGLILQDINGDGLTDPMTIIGARYNNLLSIPDQLDLDPITYSRLLLIMQDVHGQSFPLGSAPDEPSTACTDNASTPCSHNNRRIYINIATAQPQQDPWSPKLAPDFMNYSQDGLGNESEWFYAPLSADVTSSHGMPLYSVPQRDAGLGYVEEDDSGQYFYFTSSMRVVSSFEQSNGLGSRNKTEYGYEEAIFNNLGRGFQGFRKVASEYTPAGMTADAIRNISIFHQIFPLAGKLERTYSQLASQPYTAGDAGQGLALSSTAYNWGCRLPQGAPGNPYAGTCYIDSSFDVTYSAAYSLGSGSNTSNRIYQPLLLSTTSNTNDLSAHQSGNSQSINHTAVTSDYDQYGNNTWQETVTIDHGYMTHTQQVVNAYANADTTNWWLDKLLSSEVTSQVSYNQSADSVYQQVDNTPSRFPERPMTLTSRFGWDGTTDQYRKPACQYTVDGTAGGVAGCSINYSTGTKTSYGYNAYGAVTQTTVVAAQPDPFVARTSTLGYSADGYFPKTVTNAKGHQTITDVDPAYGNPTLITSVHPVSNLLTVIDYDDFGAETHRFYPDNNSDDFNATGQHYAPRSSSAISSCSLPGNPNVVFCSTASTDGAPQTVSYLDAVGRVHRTETTSMNDETVVVEMGYNARGDKLFETVPHFESAASSFSSTYQYDELGRVVKKSQPANSGTQYSYYRYDGLITTVKVTSENITNLTSPLICSFIEEQLGSSLCVRRTYLSNGSLYSTTDAHNGITRFWNDGQGNPALIRDAMGSLTAASYNSLGHRTQLFDPNMGHWQFTYNGLGEVLTQLDAKGQSQTFDYDVLGRMLSRGIAGGNLTPTADNWVYDGDVNGVLYQETRTLNPGVAGEYISYKRDYVYDTANSLLTQHSTTLQPFDNNTLPVLTVAMLNDSYFARPISISYPSRLQTHLIYDKNGIAITEQEADSTNGQLLRTVQAVTPTGQISQELLGNGVTQLYEYNARTWQMNGVDAAAGQILEIDYIHDVFGNLTQQNIVSSGYVEDFTYDKLHRLQTSSRSGNSQSLVEYDYDPVGNITRKSDYGEGYLYNPSQPNAVKSLTMMDSGQTRMEYDYDDNGNLTKGFKVVANDSQQHLSVVYDGFNKPLTMVRDNAALNFLYGSNNARFYQYDQNNRVTVYLDKIYEQINGITEKYYIGDYAYWSVGGADAGLHFLHKDRLGSVRAITNLGGTLKEDSNRGYDPFGKPRDGDTGDDSAEGLVRDDLTTRGFTQHEHLNSVELIHMNGRAYDYNLGRFLSVDPFIQEIDNSQSLNPYSYILNNPLSSTDPTGYKRELCGEGGAGGNCFVIDFEGTAGYEFHSAQNRNGATYNQPLKPFVADGLKSNVSEIGAPALRFNEDGASESSEEETLEERMTRIRHEQCVILKGAGSCGASKAFKKVGEVAETVADGVDAMMPHDAKDVIIGAAGGGVLYKGGKLLKSSGKLQRYDGPKPTYHVNDAHVPGRRGFHRGKTPLPDDAEKVFQNAVPNDPVNPTAWFGKNKDGEIYRFSLSNDGTAHFSGIDGVGDGVRNLTQYAIDRMNGL